MLIGGWMEGQACADPGARTPIGASGNLYVICHPLIFIPSELNNARWAVLTLLLLSWLVPGVTSYWENFQSTFLQITGFWLLLVWFLWIKSDWLVNVYNISVTKGGVSYLASQQNLKDSHRFGKFVCQLLYVVTRNKWDPEANIMRVEELFVPYILHSDYGYCFL